MWETMDSSLIISYLNGAIMMAGVVGALYFWKFYKATRDSFFAWFASAFLLFSIDRLALLALGGFQEVSPAVYGIRVAGFLMIIIAVVRKNRRQAVSD